MKTKNETALKCYSIAFLCLAAFTFLSYLFEFLVGSLSVDALVSTLNLNVSLVKTVIYIMAGIVALIVICEVFLGVKGLRQANGSGSGSSHIVLATIALVVSALGLIVQIVSAFQGNLEWLTLLRSSTSVLIVIGYLQVALAVKKQR